MSVYSTREITRSQAIKELEQVRKPLEMLTNKELEEEMFNLIGGEWLPNSPLNNYIVTDGEDEFIFIKGEKYKKVN